jgi:uroporphyrin-III C-methyltransferase
MAMSKLEAIMDIFREYGKQDTPVAVIQNGTTPEEKWVIGSVKDIAFKAEFAAIANPAIIVVGEVVSLHPSLLKEKLNYQTNNSLLSKRY